MKIGELEIDVLRKQFYCRYCEDESECERKKQHRRGIAYVIQIRVKDIVKQFVITDGEFEDLGELEPLMGKIVRGSMSGATEYQHGYVTCGGWVTLYPRELSPNEYFEPSEVDYDPIVFARVLNDHRDMILTSLVRSDRSILELDWGLWNAIKPLIYAYVSRKTVPLPQEAHINYEPYSFRATFKLRDIEIPVVKARPSVTTLVDYVELRLGEKTKIIYRTDLHRAVVILRKGWKTYLYEQYRHRDVQIYDLTYSDKDEHYLLFNRLGKVVFVPKILKSEDYQEVKNEEIVKTLSEFHIVNAKFYQVDNDVFLIPEDKSKDVLIYHNDYGALILNAQPYQLEFIMREENEQ